MKYSVATDYNNLNSGKGFKKGSTTVNVDGSPDLSLNLPWTTNLESGDNYILATDSFTANHTNNTSSAIPVFYTMERSELDIISASNGLPSSPRNFTTSGSGLNFITFNNYFILDPNNPLPNVVTTGSVLILDAKQISSYPTTGSTWYDLSGNGNNFILTNGAVFQTGNQVIDFDGVNDYVRLAAPKQLTGEIGFTCFFRLEDSTSFRSLLGDLTSPDPGNDEKLGFLGGSPNNIFFRAVDNGSAVNWDIGYTSANDNKWNFVAFSRTNTNTLQASLNGNPWVNGGVLAGTFNYDTIGANGDGQFFIGQIRNVNLYEKSLSEAEMKQNYYQAPIVTDGLVFAVDAGNIVSYERGSTTTYSLTGSLSGSLVNGVGYSSGNGGGWVFDGVNDRVQTNFSISEVEATVMLATSPISSTSGYYVAQSAGGGDGGGRFLISATNGKDFSLRIGQQTLVTTGEFNMWYILTVTRNLSGLTTFYNNGVVVGTFTNTTPFVSGRILDIGGSTFVSNRSINGNIGNVLIYNRSLSQEEVSQNFQAQRSRFGL